MGELRMGPWYQRGATAATYRPRGALKRGGELVVAEGDDTFELKPSSTWRNRYALWSGETELAAVETKGWSGQEVAVDLSDNRSVEALVLLMALLPGAPLRRGRLDRGGRHRLSVGA